MSNRTQKLLALVLALMLCLNTPLSVLAEGGLTFNSAPVKATPRAAEPEEKSYKEQIEELDPSTLMQPRYTIAFGSSDNAKESGEWTVPTGANVMVAVTADLQSAPRVQAPDGSFEDLFTRYTDVDVYVAIDSRLTVCSDAAMKNKLTPVRTEDGMSYYAVVENASATAISGTQTVARGVSYYVYDPMNGERPDGVTYLPTFVSAFATVSAADKSGDVRLAVDSTNRVDLINRAGAPWNTVKAAAENTPVLADDAAVFTYHIDIGLPGNTGVGVSNEPDIYNAFGTLRLESAVVTDRIMAVQTAGGDWVWPEVRGVVTQNGTTVNYSLEASASEPAEGEYITLTIVDQWESMTSHSRVPGGDLPAFTRYAVEVAYNAADFTLPYGDDTDFIFADDAALHYELVDGTENDVTTPVVEVKYHRNEEPATIVVRQNLLKRNGVDLTPYGVTYQGMYGAMSYRAYLKDTDPDDAEWHTLNEGSTLTLGELTRGTYVVEWLMPDDAAEVLDALEARSDLDTLLGYTTSTEIDVTPGETTDVYFTCQPKLVGILSIRGKHTPANKALAGASFTAIRLNDEGEPTGDEVTFGPTDGRGDTAVRLALGKWRIVESTVPGGYLAIRAIDIELDDARSEIIIEGDALIDYENLATISLGRHSAEWLGDESFVTDLTEGDETYLVAPYTMGEDGQLTPAGDPQQVIIPAGESETEIEVARYLTDDRTKLILYKVSRISDETCLGTSVNNGARTPATATDLSFELDEETDARVDYYVQRVQPIKITKSVVELSESVYNRKVSDKLGGWTITVEQSGTGEIFTVVTDEHGTAMVANLPLTDDQGNRYTYTITEIDGEELDDYEVTYAVNGKAGDAVTLITGQSAQVQVTNTRKRAQLKLTKSDADDGTLLPGASYQLFAAGESAPMTFVKQDGVYVCADGLDVSDTVDTVVTDASGEVLMTRLPAGAAFVLRETEAPAGYYLDDTDHEIPALASASAMQLDLTDVKLPEIKVTKQVYHREVVDMIAEGEVHFLVGTIDDAGNFVPLADKTVAPDGATLATPTDIRVDVTMDQGESDVIQLPDVKGEVNYYAIETSQHYSMLPPEIESIGDTSAVTYNGKTYRAFGPVSVDFARGTAEEVTIEVKDVANAGRICVQVFDDKVYKAAVAAKGDTEVAALLGRDVRVDVRIDADDEASAQMLAELNFRYDSETGTWYRTERTHKVYLVDGSELSRVYISELPVYDLRGNKLTYRVCETSEENDNYFANNEGVKTYTPADDHDHMGNVAFFDEPKARLIAGKFWIDEFHQFTGYPRNFPLNGVELALYRVIDDTLVYVGSGVTASYTDPAVEGAKAEDGLTVFNGLHAEGQYVLVEVGRYKQYLLNDLTRAGAVEKTVLESADGLHGMPLSVMNDYNAMFIDMNVEAKNPVINKIDQYKTSEDSLKNYRPYSQINLHKLRYANRDKGLEDDRTGAVPLNGAKFKLYRVPVSVALQAAISTGALPADATESDLYAWLDTLVDGEVLPVDAAAQATIMQLFNGVSASVGADDYVYETMNDGTFMTEPLETFGYVYFMKESFAPSGIDMAASFGLSGPFYAYMDEDTQDVGGNLEVNGTTESGKSYNVPSRGGSSTDMFFPVRVEIQKVLANKTLLDEGETNAYMGLADIRFSLVLTDGEGVLGVGANGQVVSFPLEDVLSGEVSQDRYWHSNFTTGLSSSGASENYVSEAAAATSVEGFGVSETVYLKYNKDKSGLETNYADYLRFYDADGNRLTKQGDSYVNEAGEAKVLTRIEGDFLLLEMKYPDDVTVTQSVYPVTLGSGNTAAGGAAGYDRTYTGTHAYDGKSGYIRNSRETKSLVRLWKIVAKTEQRDAKWLDLTVERDIGETAPKYVRTGSARLLGEDEEVTLSVYATTGGIIPKNAEPICTVTLNADIPSSEVLKLNRNTVYAVVETYGKGELDLASRNTAGYTFTTFGTEDRMHVQEIVMTDNLYNSVTITKLDVNGAPVKDVTLRLQYFEPYLDIYKELVYADYDENIVDPSGTLMTGTTLVTGEDGKAQITLPYYNYAKKPDDAGRYKTASYTLAETADGTVQQRYFKLINEYILGTLPFEMNGTKQVTVYNPGTTTLTVNKKSIIGQQNGEDVLTNLEGASFNLYFVPFDTKAEYLGTDEVWPEGMTEKLSGDALMNADSDENGLVKFTGLYSGWYRLSEETPASQVGNRKPFDVYFRMILPEDAALIGGEGAGITLYDAVSGKPVQQVTASQYVSQSTNYGKTSHTAFVPETAHADADGCAMFMQVNNTAKAHLLPHKTFIDKRDDGAVPDSIGWTIAKRTQAAFSQEVSKGLVCAVTGYFTIDGDVSVNDETLSVQPGDYWFVEQIDAAEQWYGTAVVNGGEAAKTQKPVVVGDRVYSAVPITLKSSDLAEQPLTVDLYNRNTHIGIELNKKDDAPVPADVDGAVFALFYLDAKGVRHYYKGVDGTKVMGDWSAKTSAQAKTFVTADGGKLSIDAAISQEMVEGWFDDSADQTVTVYLEEISAPQRWYTLADIIAFDHIVPGTVQTEYTHTVVWEENGTGEVTRVDKTVPATSDVIDKSGLYLDVMVRGRTYENWAADEAHEDRFLNADSEDAAVVALYLVNAAGKYTLVERISTEDAQIADDGTAYLPFSHLELLGAGERYVLVESSATSGLMPPVVTGNPDEGYLRIFAHSNRDADEPANLGMGEEQSVYKTDASDAYGFTLMTETSETNQSGTLVKVNLFNEPTGSLLILKYNYERPDDLERMALRAEFSLLKSTETAAIPGYIVYNNRQGTLGDVTIDGKTYAYRAEDGKYYYADDNRVYAFHEVHDVVPGDYTVTEITAADDFFFTPNANEHQAWYAVRKTTVDTDGGTAVVVFANIPVPSNNDIKVKKTAEVESVSGGDVLASLQRTFPDGEPQRITYTIDGFAANGASTGSDVDDCIVYPIKDGLWLEDGGTDADITETQKTGLSFTTTAVSDANRTEYTGRTATEAEVTARIITMTIGAAGYKHTTLSPETPNDGSGLMVDVFGVSANGLVTAEPLVSLPITEPQTVDMAAMGDYEGFRLRYYDKNAQTRGEFDLDAGFYAAPVKVTMSLLQRNDPSVELATKVNNTVGVKMMYNIGLSATATYAAVSASCANPIDYLPEQAQASILKQAKTGTVEDEGEWSTDKVELTSDQSGAIVYNVSYRVVFANEDTERVIPQPVLVDVLPRFIRNPAELSVRTIGADGGKAASLTDVEPVVVYDAAQDKFYIYITYTEGTDELRPGEQIELIFSGEVDYGALASIGKATLHNSAYGASLKIIEKSVLNPFGAPFTSGDGASAVSQILYDDQDKSTVIPLFADYGAIATAIDHQKNFVAEVSLLKFAAGDMSGADNYRSGRTTYAVASSDGEVYFRLQASCDSGSATDVVIIDQIPYMGDTDLLGRVRGSQLSLAGVTGDIRVIRTSAAGVETDITAETVVEYYEGTGNAANDAKRQRAGEGWLPFTAPFAVDRAGYAMRFSVGSLSEGDTLDVYFTCAAPSGVIRDAYSNVSGLNYNKMAINDAFLSYKSGEDKQTYTKNSNMAMVTVLPGLVSLGDSVWLDVNANGLRDAGEPIFAAGQPGVAASITAPMQLITYTNKNAVTMLSQPLTSGTYLFEELETATLKDTADSDSPYTVKDGKVVFDYAKLNGSSRKSYQLAIARDEIPEGYVVTVQYAKGVDSAMLGQPADVNQTSQFYYYLTARDSVAGRDVDNDFDPLSTGDNYTTSRFYLPMSVRQSGIDYPTFDLGLVRTRDLTIAKTGSNGKTVAGAVFAIYPAPEGFAGGEVTLTGTPIATLDTGADGTASFQSTQANYLNCYGDYIVVELSAPKGYATTGFTAKRGDTVLGHGEAAISGKTYEYFLLKGDVPATDEAADLTDVTVDVVDRYNAYGNMSLSGEKKLSGNLAGFETLTALVNERGESLFGFTIQSADADFDTANAPFALTERLAINTGTGALTWTRGDQPVWYDGEHFYVKPAADADYVQLPDSYVSEAGDAATLYFVVTENALMLDGVTVDPAVYHVAMTLTDKTDDGILTATYAWTRYDGESAAKNSGIVFTNTLQHGTLTVSKAGAGNAVNEAQEFAFTVTLGRDDVLSDMLDNTTKFTYTKTAKDGTATIGTLTRDKAGALTFTLKAGEQIAIGDILYGTDYTVTEADYSETTAALTADKAGYKTTLAVDGGDPVEALTIGGTVDATTPAEKVAYTNARNAGRLTIGKTMTGNATTETDDSSDHSADLTAKLYNFTLVLTNGTVAPAGTYKVTSTTLTAAEAAKQGFTTDDAGNIYLTVDTTGTTSFQLKHGQTITVENIVSGTAYAVSEADERQTHGVVTSYDGKEKGTITSEGEEQTEYATTVTNERFAGTLSVTKATAGAPKAGQKFHFTLTLELPQGTDTKLSAYAAGKTYSMKIGTKVTYFTLENGQYGFDLASDETAIFGDLMFGTKYTVAEDDYWKTESGKRGYEQSGYVTTWTSTSGKIGKENVQAALTATNTRNAGTVTIGKTVAGAGDNTAALEGGKTVDLTAATPYRFTVTLVSPDAANIVMDGKYEIEFTKGAYHDGQHGIEVKTVGDVDHYYVTIAKAGTEGEAQTAIDLYGGQEIRILNIPTGDETRVTKYRVTENDYRTEHGTVKSGEQATDKAVTTAGSATTVTNTRNTGKLTVRKATAGNAADEAQAFNFTVALDYPETKDADLHSYAAGKQYSVTIYNAQGEKIAAKSGIYSLANGALTFALANGEYAEIGDVLYDTAFTVTEDDYSATTGTLNYEQSGYLTTAALNGGDAQATRVLKGAVDADHPAANAAYTNERNAGRLTIGKTMTGNATTETDDSSDHSADLTAKLYNFTLVLTNGTVAPTGTYKVTTTTMTAAEAAKQGFTTDDAGNIYLTVDTTGTANFQLKHGQTITVENIVSGTAYAVSEADERQTHGVVTSYDGKEKGPIDSTGAEQTEYATTVTNERFAGTLSVTKATAGAPKAGQKFHFTLTLELPQGTDTKLSAYAAGKTYSMKIGTKVTYFTLENGQYGFDLASDETAIFGDLMYGTNYTVAEDDYWKTESGKRGYEQSGYVTTWTSTSGKISKENVQAALTATNTRNAGTVTIGKTVAGAGDNTAALEGGKTVDLTAATPYRFTVTLVSPDAANIVMDGKYEIEFTKGAYHDGQYGIEVKTVGDVDHYYVTIAKAGTDGEAQTAIDLYGGQEIRILNIPTGDETRVTKYRVTENDYRTEHGTVKNGEQATDKAVTTAGSATTVTNTRNTGKLTVRKATAGNAADEAQAFNFTVALDYPETKDADLHSYAAGKQYSVTIYNAQGEKIAAKSGIYSLSSGALTFALANGEYAEIGDVLYDTAFTVTENDYSATTTTLNYEQSGYLTTAALNGGDAQTTRVLKGAVDADHPAANAAYTNARNAGRLTIGKTMTGNATTETDNSSDHSADLTAKLYSFTLVLTNGTVAPAGTYKVTTTLTTADAEKQGFTTDAEGNIYLTVDTTGTASFQLKHGQTITVENIVSGTAYAVSEADERQTHGVVTSYDGKEKGTITSEGEEQTEYATTVTNERFAGTLSVTKATAGAPKAGQKFHFTLTLELPQGADAKLSAYAAGKTYSMKIGTKVTYFTLENGRYGFDLASDETAIFGDLMFGTNYTVAEDDYWKTESGKRGYEQSGYVTTWTATSGKIGKENVQAALTATNTRNAGTVTIGKTVAGAGDNTAALEGGKTVDLTAATPYRFTVTLVSPDAANIVMDGKYEIEFTKGAYHDGQYGIEVKTVGDVDHYYVTIAKAGTEGEAQTAIDLYGGQEIRILNIPTGDETRVTKYRVTENDYRTEHGTVKSGEQATDKAVTTAGSATTVTNTRNTGKLTVRKATAGNAADEAQAFNFTVALDYPETKDADLHSYAAGKQYSVTIYNAQGEKIAAKSGIYSLSSGALTFALANGEYAEIGDVLYDTAFTVTENDYSATTTTLNYEQSGYLTTAALNGGDAQTTRVLKGAVDADHPAANAAYTNARNAGRLTIGKTMTGNATTETDNSSDHSADLTAKLYNFTLVLTNGTVAPAGTYKVTSTTLTAAEAAKQGFTTDAEGNIYLTVDTTGTASFQLKHGQTITLENIVSGTAYAVSEADERQTHGVVTSYDGKEKGTITSEGEEQTEYATTVTNTRNAGSLTVEKQLNGNAATTPISDFRFTVKLVRTGDAALDAYAAAKTYSLTIGDETRWFTLADDVVTFTLKGGQQAVIGDIPDGMAFTVTEQDYRLEGYTTTIASDTAQIDEAQAQASGVISAKAAATNDQTVVYTNTRYTEQIIVRKVVDGNAGSTTQGFRFVIRLSHDKTAVARSYPALFVNAEGEETQRTVTFTPVDGDVKRGEYHMVLKDGEALYIDDLVSGTAYTVTEENYRNTNSARGYVYSGYTTAAERETTYFDENTQSSLQGNGSESWRYGDNDERIVSGKLTRSDSISVLSQDITFTNTRNAGSLSVGKELTGTAVLDADQAFRFTVTLKRTDAINLTGVYTTRLFTADSAEPTAGKVYFHGENGEVSARITLHAGERLVIDGILDGTAYTVTEDDYRRTDGITTRVNDADAYTASGAIDSAEAEQTTAEVKAVNNRDAGKLIITKQVKGETADKTMDFTFTVQLSHTDAELNAYLAGKTFTMVKTLPGGAQTTETFRLNAAGSYTFTLRHGETAQIHDVLYGTAFTVTEADYNAQGYVPTPENRTVTGIIEGAEQQADFVNTRTTSSLTVTKRVDGRKEADRRFAMTITLHNPNGMNVTGIYPTADGKQIEFIAGENGDAVAKIELSAGQSITINNLLVGTEYTVKEADYAEFGYKASYNAGTGVITEEGAKAVVTNIRTTGTLKLTKHVVVNGDLDIPADTLYTFAVTLTLPDGMPFSGTLVKVDEAGGESAITFRAGRAIVQLRGGESVTIDGILIGSTYAVTEAELRGVTITATGETGTVDADGARAIFTNTYTQEYIDLNLRKVWDDDNNELDMRPESIRVAVSDQGGLIEEVVLNEANGWAVSLAHLPKFLPDGTAITYTVEELEVPEGYRCFYDEDEGTIVIINRLIREGFNDDYIYIDDLPVPIGAGMNMNEGDCFD